MGLQLPRAWVPQPRSCATEQCCASTTSAIGTTPSHAYTFSICRCTERPQIFTEFVNLLGGLGWAPPATAMTLLNKQLKLCLPGRWLTHPGFAWALPPLSPERPMSQNVFRHGHHRLHLVTLPFRAVKGSSLPADDKTKETWGSLWGFSGRKEWRYPKRLWLPALRTGT